MEPDYQRLVRHDSSRGLLRELGMGIALVAAIVLGCLVYPVQPGETSEDLLGRWLRDTPKVEAATAVGAAAPR